MNLEQDQDHAPQGTYAAMKNLLGNLTGISIANPQMDRCALILKSPYSRLLPWGLGICVSFHDLAQEEEIKLARIVEDDIVLFSVPSRTETPRENVTRILKGIGTLITEPDTQIRPTP